ncbi:MAG: hypothetical protein Q9190_001769 [Brigantiaea leucoxantha]
MNPVEILVHVSAPSRGVDDARYRREAEGILAFASAARHDVTVIRGSRSDHPPHHSDARRLILEDAAAPSTRDDSSDPHPQHTDTLDTSYSPTPRHRINEAFNTWVTPLVPLPLATRRDSGRALASALPTTFPWTKSHVLIERTPAYTRPLTAPSGSFATQETSVLRRTLSDSFEGPPTCIPDSQPSPPSLQQRQSSPLLLKTSDAAASKRHLVDDNDDGHAAEDDVSCEDRNLLGSKRLHQETAIADATSNSAEQSSSPVLKRRQLEHLPAHDAPTSASFPTSGNFGRSESFLSSLNDVSIPDQTLSQLPPSSSPAPVSSRPSLPFCRHTIHPPRPKPALSTFTTHQSDALRSFLAICLANHRLARSLDSLRPRRHLYLLERGHWVFDFPRKKPPWSTGQREKLWSFLERFVGEGKAGWGVWCVMEGLDRGVGAREEDVSTCATEEEEVIGTASKEGGSERDEDGEEMEVVKVYCWGEVVREVWLLLLLGSGRGIKGRGARWIDAAGNVVVQMP